MKRVTISFGVEVTSAVVTETKGKVIKVIKKVIVNNSEYYENNGTLNYQEIIKELKLKIGKELKSLNVHVVTPDYLTDISYGDSANFDGKKEKELPNHKDRTLKNKRISYIGDSIDKSISQIIYYGEKENKAFLKELYKEKINVVELISHYTALHNSIAVFNDRTSYSGNKTRIMVDLGVRRTGLIILINNLPVYIKNSGNNLISCYERLRKVYENLEFKEFIRIAKSISLDEKIEIDRVYINDSDEERLQRENEEFDKISFSDDMYEEEDIKEYEEDENEEYTVETQLVRDVKSEVLDMLKMLGTEIIEVKNYVDEKYNAENIEIVGSSHLTRKYITKKFNLLSINNYKLLVNINTGRNELDISEIEDVTIDLLLCIGSIVESMKKGADYYE